MKIEITTDSDSCECDCCGMSYADGGEVTIDGELVLSRPASASCVGSESWTEGELLVMALKKLGHEVIVDDQPFHVSRHDTEYHGAHPDL
jgi:hypothetical protein